MDERCFRPLLCIVKAELGQGEGEGGGGKRTKLKGFSVSGIKHSKQHPIPITIPTLSHNFPTIFAIKIFHKTESTNMKQSVQCEEYYPMAI